MFVYLLLFAAGALAASRTGGDADIVYESLNAGGASFAAASLTKFGGSLGQSGLMLIGTNASGQTFLNGFWKAEDGCTLYNPTIVNLDRDTNGMAITFMVVNSNQYEVAYVAQEQGGLTQGSHAITNLVQTLVGEGPAGSRTTVWHNVTASTNVARFYIIRCQP